MPEIKNIHATVVVFEGGGVLLQGKSGIGKTDLALRLIEAGGQLVSDDRCDLEMCDGQLVARAPEALKGLLELRGFGIVKLSHINEIKICLSVELVNGQVERMPEPEYHKILDCNLRHVQLRGLEASAVAKLRHMIRAVMTSDEY